MQRRLLNLRQFTETFGISRSAIYQEATAGRLHFTKIGRRTFVAIEDGEAWLKAAREASRRH